MSRRISVARWPPIGGLHSRRTARRRDQLLRRRLRTRSPRRPRRPAQPAGRSTPQQPRRGRTYPSHSRSASGCVSRAIVGQSVAAPRSRGRCTPLRGRAPRSVRREDDRPGRGRTCDRPSAHALLKLPATSSRRPQREEAQVVLDSSARVADRRETARRSRGGRRRHSRRARGSRSGSTRERDLLRCSVTSSPSTQVPRSTVRRTVVVLPAVGPSTAGTSPRETSDPSRGPPTARRSDPRPVARSITGSGVVTLSSLTERATIVLVTDRGTTPG